ncbi:MAG: hypothetical protein NTV19_20590, partial [Burkholderiales bacterium]|nr:hypothetical protein [Burkholderiales bacterium]
MLGAHRQRALGRAAEEDRRGGLLQRFDRAPGAAELVVAALVIEGLVQGPDPAQHAQVLGCALVAGVLLQEVALALLLAVADAGDDVQRQAAARQVVEGRRG